MSKAASVKRVSAVVAKFVPWHDVPGTVTARMVQWDGHLVVCLPGGRWSAYRESRTPWVELYLDTLVTLGLVRKGDVDPYREWLVVERSKREEQAERGKLAELIAKYGVPKQKKREERS